MVDVLGAKRGHDGFDDIDAVFVYVVVATGFGRAAGTIVVDGQTSADIQVAHRGAFTNQIQIESTGFGDAVADVANVWDL